MDVGTDSLVYYNRHMAYSTQWVVPITCFAHAATAMLPLPDLERKALSPCPAMYQVLARQKNLKLQQKDPPDSPSNLPP